MLVSDFDYKLPEELIAQTPPAVRGSSRMLVVNRTESKFHDDEFRNFPQYLKAGDCLVLNSTKVFPARLHGRKTHTGAEIEVFLVRVSRQDRAVWRALVRPGKRVRTGDTILFDDSLRATVLAEEEYGERDLRFDSKRPLDEEFERLGRVPLPPYIHREPTEDDRGRYQTVYAEKSGSVAAPTAGLHFTDEILAQCRERGAELAKITLHVGLGTFAPLRGNDFSQIQLHEEYFEIPADAAERLKVAQRIVAVGTTSVRTLETAMLRGGLSAMQGDTNLFIYPGYRFRTVGVMLTNFHLPQSSLLLLVCAFGGKELILNAYQHAVQERYRFFSYGDCMLIL